MAMQASDPTVCHSSIALLQERFRRLERAKEMREERELFRLLSETLKVNHPTCYYEQFFQVESYGQQAPQTTLKLQPCLLFMRKNAENKDTVMQRQIVSDDEYSDVDTSLHL
ncbi:hypothetical protein QQ045_007312 [Rhodiola kirilowii]